MPVALSVRQIRDAIYREAGLPAGPGNPSSSALGTLFHSAAASLLDSQSGSAMLLAAEEPSLAGWSEAIRRHLYRTVVGPWIAANRSGLPESTPAVLSFWQAIENFCPWLAGLLWEAHSETQWPAHSPGSVATEETLTCELQEPGWRDRVRLTGVADCIWRAPGKSGTWCVVEFKLGRTSPEADLAQACLYHMMLSVSESRSGSLALVSFEPELREHVFEASKLLPAQTKLKALIGRLARVLPDGQTGAPTPHSAVSAETPASVSQATANTLRLLMKALAEYGAPAVSVGTPIQGPMFTRFLLAPGRGVRSSAILKCASEIQVRLGLKTPPLLNTGPTGISVDIERPDRQLVTFSSIEHHLPAADALTGSSRFPIGVNLEGHLVLGDFSETRNAHFLVAGTTGSGKSEWLRTVIAGLTLRNTPATLQLVLIDPKRTAFPDLKHSAFLYGRAIVHPDEHSVLETFENLVEEMEARYRLFEQTGTEHLIQYVRKTGVAKPRMVCVCDEYADLIKGVSRRERDEIERQFTRLGSKARAAGIHLILATQEVRRETIRGPIDANLGARVGFRMGKDIESRLLLSQNGAENLLGLGDLLFRDIGAAVRLQAPYLSPEDRKRIFAA